jgi:branched-chain amino acid transport system permease protein
VVFLGIFAQQMALGIVNGIGYALVATGLTLIFGIMNVINFAHGEFYMLGAFVIYTIITFCKLDYILALILTPFIVGGIGMLCETFTVRPLRARPEITLLLATMALSLMMVNGAQMIWTGMPKRIPNDFEGISLALGPVYLTYQRIFIAILGFGIAISLQQFLKRTTMGKLMRATAQNQDGSVLVGINIHWVHNFTFGLGCALAGISGALLGSTTMIYPYIGQVMVIKAFVIVILGGLGSVPGAILGGIALGMVEAIAGGFISIEYKDVFGYALIIIILMLKPAGLFGKKRT